METNVLTILLAMLGSSVITAIITMLGKRRTDQAVINDTLLENARADISQIRQENSDLRVRIDGLEKRINTLKNDIEEREILIRIADKENLELKNKVDGLPEGSGNCSTGRTDKRTGKDTCRHEESGKELKEGKEVLCHTNN